MRLIQKAVAKIAQGMKQPNSDYVARFLMIDADLFGRNLDRDHNMITLAPSSRLTLVRQDVCIESVLLRHFPGHESDSPADSNEALKQLQKVWPEYHKAMSGVDMAKRLQLADVLTVAKSPLNSGLPDLLAAIGLLNCVSSRSQTDCHFSNRNAKTCSFYLVNDAGDHAMSTDCERHTKPSIHPKAIGVAIPFAGSSNSGEGMVKRHGGRPISAFSPAAAAFVDLMVVTHAARVAPLAVLPNTHCWKAREHGGAKRLKPEGRFLVSKLPATQIPLHDRRHPFDPGYSCGRTVAGILFQPPDFATTFPRFPNGSCALR